MKIFRKNIEERTDQELLEHYQKSSDSGVLGELFNRYMHLVYGVCLKYLKSREDAQDAVMGIFEQLPLKIVNQEITHFKSWLYIVSKNHCLMELRRSKKMEVLNGSFMENDLIMHPNEEEQPLEADLIALERCIEELRDDQQRCVRLFFLEQKSYKEIVDQSSIKLSKVKSYIQNGKRNLKICLEKHHVKR